MYRRAIGMAQGLPATKLFFNGAESAGGKAEGSIDSL